ncbi:hypothetical protein SAMN02745172_03906 [Pseudoxanthobacter soli DSM 19599]|uniref:Uncharacterized protein n=1 Tax=Pseudoxanthobacter soli DSM 19599 TaxID=1123029 RepID=A0A1M7ZQP3_9HYPH|nr:hypothetical protein [Pseudoxanthobacter soli]SHO67233.1 hypothetical protein SAMN02745172_03906 [Pseudoxanthobacter soli DSM 19599]
MSSHAQFTETENRLADFDMALSISEKAINHQMQEAWSLWLRRKDGARLDRISLNPPNRKGSPSRTVLDAVLGAPRISLFVPMGGPNDVRVSFPIISGTLQYLDEDDPVVEKIDNWLVTFLTVVDRKVVSRDELYRQDQSSARRVDEIIARHGLGEGAFSIECLFLTLTAADMIRSRSIEPDPEKLSEDQRRNPPTIATATQSKLADCLAHMFTEAAAEKRKFILGTSVHPRALERAPTFTLKDYLFKVTRTAAMHGAAEVASSPPNTLDYLGVFFSGKSLPATVGEADNARARLGPWLPAERTSGRTAMVAGVMAVRGEMVNGHFSDSLRSGFGAEYTRMNADNAARRAQGEVLHPETELPHPEAELLNGMTVGLAGSAITITNQKTFRWTDKTGDEDKNLHLEKHLRLTLSPKAGAGYDVDGELKVMLNRERVMSIRNSRAKATSTAKLTGTVAFEVGGGAIFCNIVPRVSVQFATPVAETTADENWFARTFTNNEWDRQEAGGYTRDSRSAIELMLKRSIEKLNVGLDKFAFIPPGEEVFTFSSPRFTRAGDLMLDVIYKATKLMK